MVSSWYWTNLVLPSHDGGGRVGQNRGLLLVTINRNNRESQRWHCHVYRDDREFSNNELPNKDVVNSIHTLSSFHDAQTITSTIMHTTMNQGLSREDIMHILKGMNIDLSPNTKLSVTKLENRLAKALDAAQRFSNIFPDAKAGVDLSKYPLWRRKAPVVDAFTRRTWGAIFQDNRGFEDQRQLAFARINQLVPDIGKEMDKKKIGYVVLKDGNALKALIIRVRIPYLYALTFELITAI